MVFKILAVILIALLGGAFASGAIDIFHPSSNSSSEGLDIKNPITKEKTEENIKKSGDFNWGAWIGEIDWKDILFGIITAPIKFFIWISKPLGWLACWVMGFFTAVNTCHPIIGYLLLIPLVMFITNAISQRMFKIGSTWGTFILIVLGVIFTVGIVLILMGLI